MLTAKLIIQDEVNCKFEGVDVATRRQMVKALEFVLPHARHTPQFKMGRWDGKICFCDVAGRTYVNLLDKVLPILTKAGYNIEIDDQRNSHSFDFRPIDKDSYQHVLWPKGHPLAGKPIEIKQHQVDIVNDFLANTSGVALASTGAGKTIVTAILSHQVEKYGRSIVIVPTQDLVKQTEADYINMGLDVGAFYGGRKDFGKTHTICTWQSLESLNKRSKSGEAEVSLAEFISGVVCVICDETHKSKSKVLRDLLSGPFSNIPIRWGLTGTMPKADYDSVAVVSCIGPVIGEVKAADLQSKGILANLHIDILQLQDVGTAVFKTYQDEFHWLVTSVPRIKFLSSKIEEISATGNTLVLVDRIQTGEMLQSMIPGSVFVSGQMKSDDRKDHYDEVQSVDNKVIIASFSVASTGISINRIFNLILLEPGKSFVKVIQSIGRGLRVSGDKDFVNVYDICSTSKYSRRHLADRKKFYTEAQYPHKVSKVVY